VVEVKSLTNRLKNRKNRNQNRDQNRDQNKESNKRNLNETKPEPEEVVREKAQKQHSNMSVQD